MKNIYVSQISDYIASMIEDEFYVVALSKSVTDKSGIPYYRLVLADKTGTITGIVWDQHMEQISEKLIHTIVRIKAEVFNNKNRGVELIINEIKKVECSDISDFMNRLDDQLKNKYFTTLRKMGEMVKNTSYKQLISIMISENENILKDAPLSLIGPCNYNGAVLVQIVSVTSIAVQIARSQNSLTYPPYKKGTEIDSDLIITGTILATIGNINRFSSFPISTIAASTSLLTSELQAIQLLEKCLKNDTILISDNEKNTLYNIIHTVHNNSIKPRIREAAIIRSAYQIYNILIRMDYKTYENQ